MKALATALMVTATLVGMSAAHADGKTREQAVSYTHLTLPTKA